MKQQTLDRLKQELPDTNAASAYLKAVEKGIDKEQKFSLPDNDSTGRKLSEEQQEFYKNVSPKLKDEDGNLKRYYHGTARADRVGTLFDPNRATSGPMAYFTDNPEIATNYSRDKRDTSLAYDSDYYSYETQFRLNDTPFSTCHTTKANGYFIPLKNSED